MLAPVAVKFVLSPAQIAVLATEIVGSGFTVTVEFAVFTQPAAEVPVTV